MVRSQAYPHAGKNVRVARWWDPVPEKPGYVRCRLCHRRCLIAPGSYGACGVRKNLNGALHTLVYGLLTAVNLDPIEKKPLMHFEPGSKVLSISTVGCNFFCKFCQNWEISQSRLEEGLYGRYTEPEEVLNLAVSYGADGISYTYNEPTVFYEYMYDTAKLVKRKGLFNTMVTNGYISPEAIREIAPYMDAATVDFKGAGNADFYKASMGVADPQPIFESLIEMKRHGIFIEVTNLVVPEVGDHEEDLRKLAQWIAENLGTDVPFHLLRFYPHYKMSSLPPTPVQTLERLADVAKEEGLEYVYIGNVWGHPLENTYCPKCKTLVIKRMGFEVIDWRLTEDNRCPRCGHKINVKGRYRGSASTYSLS